MSEIKKFILKQYFCTICNETHEINIKKEFIKQNSRFPFPYIFLHGTLKNILTTLYIDKNFEIRGVDVHELTDEDLFSKDQAILIINTLMNELETLRKENEVLYEKLKKYGKKENSQI